LRADELFEAAQNCGAIEHSPVFLPFVSALAQSDAHGCHAHHSSDGYSQQGCRSQFPERIELRKMCITAWD
jgi:hypothetical protein